MERKTREAHPKSYIAPFQPFQRFTTDSQPALRIEEAASAFFLQQFCAVNAADAAGLDAAEAAECLADDEMLTTANSCTICLDTTQVALTFCMLCRELSCASCTANYVASLSGTAKAHASAGQGCRACAGLSQSGSANDGGGDGYQSAGSSGAEPSDSED